MTGDFSMFICLLIYGVRFDLMDVGNPRESCTGDLSNCKTAGESFGESRRLCRDMCGFSCDSGGIHGTISVLGLCFLHWLGKLIWVIKFLDLCHFLWILGLFKCMWVFVKYSP